MDKFNFYRFRINLNSLRTVFLIFLTIFLFHHVYKTVQIFENHKTITINIGDFDSEEEKNNETEDEVEELDEYMFDDDKSFFLCSSNYNESNYEKLRLTLPSAEVDCPPPIF